MQAPIAKQVDHVWQRPTGAVNDPWAWLRDRDDPDTVPYLEAENAYSDAWFAQHTDLIDTIFGEIKSRVQETDLSAPVRKDDWWYVTRTEEGASYGIHCRGRSAETATEQVLLDENAEAAGHEYFSVNAFDVNPQHTVLAWSSDTDGSEQYTMHLRDLATGADRAEHLTGTTWGGTAWAADGSTLARVNRLVAETAAVAAERGLRVEARTWGRLYRLEREADPAQMFEGLPSNARLSLKYTAGDFHLFSPPSPLLAAVDERAILELDAWGEHLGFNAFPCWLGPVWAPVIRDALRRGVAQLAVRISWDNHANPLFERPWGNVVNVDLARAMAEDRDLDPDAFLRQWVDERYGPAGQDAALALYRRSTALQAVWLAEGEVELTDHSRLFRPYAGGDPFERVRDRLDRLQKAGGFKAAGDFEARRKRVDMACGEADGLVRALEGTGAAPTGWTAELARGARAQCHVARGTADQLALLFWRREATAGRPTPGLAALEARIRAWTAAWQAEDAASFALLEGGAGLALVEGF